MLAHNDLHIHQFGQGVPVVLINGLGRQTLHWCGFETVLAEEFDVYGVDNPGMGATSLKMGFESIESLALTIGAQLKERIKAPFHVVGLSMGGMIARALVRQFPGDVLSLTLINTPSGVKGTPRVFWRGVWDLIRAPFKRRGGGQLIADVCLSPNCPDLLSVIKKWRAIDRKRRVNPVTMLKQFLAVFRFREVFGYRDLPPTLIIKGALDRLVPPQNSDRLLLGMPKAQLIELEGGHEVTAERPHEVAGIVGGFIRGLTRTGH